MVASHPGTRSRRADLPAADRGRAALPDETGWIERDGVRVWWERYGTGSPTFLLLPTWSVLYSRHWKAQIPYLARHFRVVTFDGRGNGRSDRPRDPGAYADTEFVLDAVAVLDASGTDRALVAGFSMGAGYALRLAAEHADRVLGTMFIGPAIRMRGEPDSSAGGRRHANLEDELSTDEGWAKYNVHYWRRDWPGFAEFFAAEVYSDEHSTKQREDMVEWMCSTDPETIIATKRAPYLAPPPGWVPSPDEELFAIRLARRVGAPALVIHGDDDHLVPLAHAERLAELTGATMVTIAHGGHAPHGRQPVLVNRLMARLARSLRADETAR